jgi:hypothetical protein
MAVCVELRGTDRGKNKWFQQRIKTFLWIEGSIWKFGWMRCPM